MQQSIFSVGVSGVPDRNLKSPKTMCKGVGAKDGLARCMAYLHEGLNMVSVKGKYMKRTRYTFEWREHGRWNKSRLVCWSKKAANEYGEIICGACTFRVIPYKASTKS
jgi:uncharacterized CHY-type Zn-finger protein